MESSIFSGRAEDYVNFRVEYPQSVKAFFIREYRLTNKQVIADIGSGTGLLAKLLLELGPKVYGVEPNEDMRRQGEKNLAKFENFISVAGSAEQTTLESDCIDLVTAGNAFHWFNHAEAKREFKRILKPGGQIVLVRTDWKEFPAQRMKEYDDIVGTYCVGRNGATSDPVLEREVIDNFFSKYKVYNLGESDVKYTYDQLKGRFLSTSFSPKNGHPRYEDAMVELNNLYEKFKSDEKFSFGVITTVVCGILE